MSKNKLALVALILAEGFVLLSVTQAAPQRALKAISDSNPMQSTAGRDNVWDNTPQSGSGAADSNTTRTADLKNYPDYPLRSIPAQPVTLKFIVEHRSALHMKTVTVRGIVASVFGFSTSKTSSGEQSMANPQPRIVLADNLRKRRDKNLDLEILLREGDRPYTTGKSVKIRVTVEASRYAVVLRKAY